MNSRLKVATFAGLACVLPCLSHSQTLQWSTALPVGSAGGKLLLGGSELYITSELGDEDSTATLYQANESGTLTGSFTLSAASFGATIVDIQDAVADSSGNVYVLLGCSGGLAGTSNFSVVKVSPSLSQVWATSLVTGGANPLQIKLGSSNNPFVLAYQANYGQAFSFASDGSLNTGQPFQFLMPQGSYVNSLAVINANGSYPDEPYVSGNGPDPNYPSGHSGGFLASPALPSNFLWTPRAEWTIGSSFYAATNSFILDLLTDNKYVYAGAAAFFASPNASQQSAPLWSFCGSDGNVPTSGLWNRTFVGTNYTLSPSLPTGSPYLLYADQMALDNEHDILYSGAFTAMNGTSENQGMFVFCQSDITGLGKSGTLVRSDSLGLASYPYGCVGLGASVGKGVAWALGERGNNALFKFTDTASTFAFLGAASPPSTPNPLQNGLIDYFGMAVNPSTGEAYVLGYGYLSAYK